MIKDHIRKKILDAAIPLEKYGIRDLAWKKDSAIALVKSLQDDEIGILGGDVYKIELDRLIPTYDNWSSDHEEGELKKDYFLRSKSKALDYITHYPVDTNENILFSLVFTEILT